jgi:3-methylfumaryl-CoA hydratase
MEDKLEHWRRWIGHSETMAEVMDAARARALQATLGDPARPLADGDALPPLWQWIYFWHAVPAAELDADGHPARGGFMPPVDLPQRVWAGCRMTLHRPLRLGRAASRRATVTDVQAKHARSGPVVIVTLRQVYGDGDGDCIAEDVDIAYRPTARDDEPPPGAPAPGDAHWQWRLTPDAALLFRYSALTFNAHRIHYDRDYAVGVARYPGLLVHGPLLATLMAELVRRERPAMGLRTFSCRARRPCMVDAPLTVAGRLQGAGAALWVGDQAGALAMSGEAVLA